MKKRILLHMFVIAVLSIVTVNASSFIDEEVLSIYPNPADDQFTIQLFTKENQSPEIQIIDITGKEVMKLKNHCTYEVDKYKASVNINDLKSGLYFVKVIQGKNTYTKKLVVK